MAVDYFLNLTGVKGEAQDATYKDWIDIYTWSFGAAHGGPGGHTGGGSGAGKVSVQDISVTKNTDTASTDLFLKCANGKHYAEANIVARKAGEKPMVFMQMKMTQVMVNSYHLGGSHSDDTSYGEHLAELQNDLH